MLKLRIHRSTVFSTALNQCSVICDVDRKNGSELAVQKTIKFIFQILVTSLMYIPLTTSEESFSSIAAFMFIP